MDTKKILETVEEKNLFIKDVNIEKLIPNVIDNIIIYISDDKCILNLDSGFTGEKLKKWKKGRGGVFTKDVNKYLKEELTTKYVILEDAKYKIIARLINEDELEKFNHLHIIDGKIKDKAYMKVRTVYNGEKLQKSDRYIEQIDMNSDPKIIIINPNISSDSEENHKSISLFND